MVKKIIWLSILVVVFISLAGTASADMSIVKKGNSWDETCNIEEETCTRTLYSGIRNIYEDSEWKQIEDAKSLKDVWFVNWIEIDQNFDIDVIDYNYTDLNLELNFTGDPLDYPVECPTYKSADEWKCQFKVQYKEYDVDIKFDYKVEMKDGLIVANTNKFSYKGMPLGKPFKFGGNSTTILLQDADTENLDDAFISSYSTSTGLNYGGSIWLRIANDTTQTNKKEALLKFNLAFLPSTASVVNSELGLYQDENSFGLDSSSEGYNVSLHTVYTNYTIDSLEWKEGDGGLSGDTPDNGEINWNERPGVGYYDSNSVNISDVTYDIKGKWLYWNATESLQFAANNNYQNISLWLRINETFGNPDHTDDVSFCSKESTSPNCEVTEKPYLNITYIINHPIINSKQTSDTAPQYNQIINITANVTDYNDNLAWVNFTLILPNSSKVIDNVNGTVSGNIWNSSNYPINLCGDWTVNITAGDDIGLTSSEEWEFSVTMGNLTVETPYANQEYVYSQTVGNLESFNLTLSHDGNSNNTIDFILTGDLDNTSRFIVSFEEDPTIVEPSGTHKILVNITSNSSLSVGEYSGYIKANRTILDEDGIYYMENITVNITISALAGDVDIITPTFSAAVIIGGLPVRRNINIWNKGSYNLSQCNISLITSASLYITPNITGFNVTNTSNVTASILFTGTDVSSDSSATLSISCVATAAGGLDSDSIIGSISVSASSGGGGATPPTGPDCGPFATYPDGAIELFSSEGTVSPDVTIIIYNGNTSQTFGINFDYEMRSYCRITEYPTSLSPPNSQTEFSFNCRAPSEVVRGNVLISTNTGCERAIPLTIGPSIGFLAQFGDFVRLVASGSWDSFLISYHGWPVVIIIVFFMTMGLILWKA